MNKLDYTKPIQTCDGRPVELITTKGRGEFCVVGYVEKNENIMCWRADGSWYFSPFSEHRLDLINVPEPRVIFLNAYEPNSGAFGQPTLESAKRYCDNSILQVRYKIIHIPGNAPTIEVVKS